MGPFNYKCLLFKLINPLTKDEIVIWGDGTVTGNLNGHTVVVNYFPPIIQGILNRHTD